MKRNIPLVTGALFLWGYGLWMAITHIPTEARGRLSVGTALSLSTASLALGLCWAL